jgi:CDP-glucose 4,6-dehydratase
VEIQLGQQLRKLPGPVLITGHTGFIGTWASILFEELGIPVVGYSLPASEDSLYSQINREGKIRETIADIRNHQLLEEFLDQHKPSVIIHLAGQPLVMNSYQSPRETFEINVMGAVNILDSAFKKEYVKVILIVTTDKVYRNDNTGAVFSEKDALGGKDPYSSSKVGAEAAVTAWQQISLIVGGPKVVSVRVGNVIGGGDYGEHRIIPDLIRGFGSGEEVEIRNSQSTRPWQHVLDPVRGFIMLIEHLLENNFVESINFGPIDQSISVCNLVEIFLKDWKLGDIKIKYLMEEFHAKSEMKLLSLDSSFAKNVLGWSPIWSQEEAIKSAIKWWGDVLGKSHSPQSATLEDIQKLILKSKQLTHNR